MNESKFVVQLDIQLEASAVQLDTHLEPVAVQWESFQVADLMHNRQAVVQWDTQLEVVDTVQLSNHQNAAVAP